MSQAVSCSGSDLNHMVAKFAIDHDGNRMGNDMHSPAVENCRITLVHSTSPSALLTCLKALVPQVEIGTCCCKGRFVIISS